MDPLRLLDLVEGCSQEGGALGAGPMDEGALWWAGLLRVALLWARGDEAPAEGARLRRLPPDT